MFCFVEKGLTVATTKDLCTAAKLQNGGIYYYFSTKEEIVLACAEEAISRIERSAFDIVLEDIITLDKVLIYAKDYLADNKSFEQWNYKKDGASLAARKLFEEATDINMFIGRAENPAHQDMPINFNVKMQIINELADCLEQMGKRVKKLYF